MNYDSCDAKADQCGNQTIKTEVRCLCREDDGTFNIANLNSGYRLSTFNKHLARFFFVFFFAIFHQKSNPLLSQSTVSHNVLEVEYYGMKKSWLLKFFALTSNDGIFWTRRLIEISVTAENERDPSLGQYRVPRRNFLVIF